MGCCLSTNNGSHKTSAPPKHQHLPGRSPMPESDRKAPPSAPLEEETVKEVLLLSETPTPKPSFPKLEEKKNDPIRPSFPKIEVEKAEKKSLQVNPPEEISEISEICSVSESISTTTITERRDDDEERSRDDGEVRQRIDRSPAKILRKRSASGDFAGRTEGGKSPARRYQPHSPGRRNDNAATKPFHQGRELGQTQSTRRWISGSNGPKRDPGESSGRRSRSPAATRRNSGGTRPGLSRSPSSRKCGRSNGRIPAVAPVNNSGNLEDSRKEEGKWPTTNESLENPLVSLECFIFL